MYKKGRKYSKEVGQMHKKGESLVKKRSRDLQKMTKAAKKDQKLPNWTKSDQRGL